MVDEAYDTYMMLECDHGMGMTSVGAPSNMWGFNYAFSSAISSLEYGFMNSLISNGTSVTIGLGQEILDGEMPEIFLSNGYIVIKLEDSSMFLVIDPKTGIFREIGTVYGVYGFHSQITDNTVQLGEALTSTNINANP
ncbi:MAG: hypothetical protein K8E24_013620, partial [Methanobacterium paludis]|nr:hypothetical protein [Methanobacterium paludis]